MRSVRSARNAFLCLVAKIRRRHNPAFFSHTKGQVMQMTISLIRTVILYVIVMAAVRLMGKRQISEMQTSELVVTLLISNLASVPMQETGQPLINGLIPIVALVISEIVVSALMVKLPMFRKLICGRPIIVIYDGKIQQDEMRRLRMTTEDLFEQLREKDVFSIKDVAYAIVETNGKMSVIKTPEKEQPTAGALNVVEPDKGLETVVISDGVISDYSLALCRQTRNWVENILENEGIILSDVFLMTANAKGDYLIVRRDQTK
jgi:uncharacterized membrane protein YcaP (DUF421 family)